MPRAAGILFEQSGTGDVPLICLHGIGGDAGSFQPQLDELGRSMRVISWNMPGYGGSDPLPEMTFEALAGAVRSFMDALQLETAHIAGQSIGGMIAQEFALRFPERVASLILIATTPAFGGRDEGFKTEFLKARMKPLDEGRTMAELAPEFVPQIVGSKASDAAIAAAIQSMASVPENSYRAVVTCLVTFDRYADTAAIGQPACLIAGAEDRNAPARTMEKMAARMPRGAFHQIEGAGHLVNLEAPDVTNTILKQFLQSNERGRS